MSSLEESKVVVKSLEVPGKYNVILEQHGIYFLVRYITSKEEICTTPTQNLSLALHFYEKLVEKSHKFVN